MTELTDSIGSRIPAQNFDAPSSKPFCISPQLACRLNEIGARVEASAGTIIFAAGEDLRGVYLVLNGRVALWHGPDNLRVTRIAESGCLLGLPATIRRKPYSLSAEAVQDTTLSLISPEQFRGLIESDSAIATEIISLLGEELVALRDLAPYEIQSRTKTSSARR
jgi:CRP-like cAMP-binding protein